MKYRKTAVVLLICLLAGALSGCFFKSVEELYSLPKQSEEYYDLQAEIDRLMVNGASYTAPTSGANQQSVQLADLDGDGEDEAVVFLKTGADKPLKAYIFDRTDQSFQNVAVIEGDGNSFESVEYAQIDGEPGLEIVIGRQVSDQVLQSMSVYALHQNRLVELMSANYTEYTITDLDSDGNSDVFLLRFDGEERKGIAEYYHIVDDQMEREPEVQLSAGVETIKRIISGNVASHTPAIFVASIYQENSIITDIFAYRSGVFTNITTESETGTSAQTIRNYYVYAADIDDDGLIELPRPYQLPNFDPNSTETYWTIDWYNLTATGEERHKMTTYHNYSAGWYVILPDQWDAQFTVTRSEPVSGVRGHIISRWNGTKQAPEPIFTIYAFSGEDRGDQAVANGRFILGEKGDVTYAAKLGSGPLASTLTQEALIDMFNFIQVDWNSGET